MALNRGLRASTVGFSSGALFAISVTIVCALWYERVPMLDLGRFYLFMALTLSAVSGATFAAVGGAFARIAAPHHAAIALALGTGLTGTVAMAGWSLYVLGRTDRTIEMIAVAVASLGLGLGLALLAWVLSKFKFAERRIGLPALLVVAALAFALYETRNQNYPEPPRLAGTQNSFGSSVLAERPTNVLLLTIDTLRADHLSFHGYERDTSPNLSTLADRSIVFENAISQRTFTAPSLATILTGTYPPTHKTYDNHSYLRLTNVTIAEMLRSKGYQTAAATGNPGLGAAFKFDQGFDLFEAVEIRGEESVFGLDPWEAKLLNNLAFPLLDSLKDQRFFLWLHYMDPHGPYIVIDEYKDLYASDSWADRHRGSEVPSHSQEFVYGPILDDPYYQNAKLDFFISQYDAEIKYLDDKLGELFAVMDELGLWSNTLLVITADHGEGFGEHRNAYFQHYDPYEHTAHVPLIFVHPNRPGGRRISRTVGTIDILPTVLDLLGLAPSPIAQGQSLANLILSGDTTGTRPYHFTAGVGRPDYVTQAVRTDTHKLIMDFRRETFALDALIEFFGKIWMPEHFFNPYRYRSAVFELYDLESDPDERQNIATQQPERVAELTEALWLWMDATLYEGRHHESQRAGIDPEIEEALRALGYAE